MDDIDVGILNVLQGNSKASLGEIGKEVSLSPSSVGERIKKLESSGVISKYTTILDGTKFGKQLSAYMFISLDSPKYIDSFIEFVKQEDDILECHYLAGNYDYIIKIITHNPSSLEKLLNRIKSVSGIAKTYTNVILGTSKSIHSVKPSIVEEKN